MIEDNLELKLGKIMSEDEMNIFAKRKILELNVESNTIVHIEGLTILRSKKQKNKSNYKFSEDFDINKSLKVTRTNYEYLKSSSYISVNKNELENIFNKSFNNKIPYIDSKDGEHYLIKNLEKNLNFLKFDKIIAENKKIIQNKELIKKFKENNIKVNFPILFTNITEDNIDYSLVFTEMIKKIDSLKNNINNTTNITINNTLTYESPNQKLMDRNTQILNNINNMNLPIEKFNFHLTSSFFKTMKKKGNTSSFNRRLNKHNLEEDNKSSTVSLENENKILKERNNEICQILNTLNSKLNDVDLMLDRRLVSNLISIILSKSSTSKITKELLEKLSIILGLDESQRKSIGLSNSIKHEFHDLDNYYPMKEIKELTTKTFKIANNELS